MSRNVLLLRPKSTIQKVLPLGLLNLSAYLKQACPQVRVKLLDFRLDEEKSYERMVEDLDGFKPDIIGISSLTLELMESIALAEVCRELFPAATLVLGGPASSADYDVIEPLNLFDRIVVGEGEEIFKAIVNGSVSGDEITLRADDFPQVDVDYVDMPDYSAIELSDYFMRDSSHEIFQRFSEYVPIFTSRGCPFDCGFCFHLFGRKVRFRDIDKVCEEVEYLVETYGIREIHIEDDVFNLDLDRVSTFFEFLDQKNIRLAVSFPNGIIYSNVTEQLVKIFKNGGVYRASFGIESTSDKIMDLISKRHNLEKLADVIGWFDKHHILTHGFLITGFPTEIERDLDESIRFILRSRLHTFRFANYVPFKGTPLFARFRQLFEDQGLETTRCARYSSEHFYADMGAEVAKAKIRSATLRFYLSPWRMFRIALAMKKKVMLRFIGRKAGLVLARLSGRSRVGAGPSREKAAIE